MNSIDVQVQLVDFPKASSKEVVTPNEDGSFTIFINSRLSIDSQQKAYRHAMKHIIGEDFQKQEVQTIEASTHSLFSYNKIIGLHGLISAYENGCSSGHEIAEFFNVTEEFIYDALDCYRKKYGVCTTIDDYYIMFIPSLMVGKIY